MNRLEQENRAFAGTNGVSLVCRPLGFIPAFRNEATGEVVESRFMNGKRAPVHVVEGLPTYWKSETAAAHGVRIRITSGFLLKGKFFTREEAVAFRTL